MRKNLLSKLLITGAVAVGGLGFLVYSSLGHTQPYRMVDKLMTEPQRFVGKEMRIHGDVEAGSIIETIQDQQMRRTFVVTKGGKRILVRHEGPKPDTFKDLSEVVATGTLKQVGTEYEFHATELMAKCPSKYEGAPSNKALGSKPEFR
jgi:cytochrome c-type biogenesis protein CcmE